MNLLPFVLLAPLIVEEKPPVPVVPERAPTLTVPYANARSLEASAWAGLAASTGSAQLEVGALLGWFFARGFELSGIAGVAYVHPGSSQVVGSFLAEPSFHVAFGSDVMGFTGLGGGVTLSPTGLGFELAPRLGVNVLFGRAEGRHGGATGVLTPALELTYATNAPAVTSLGATIGYGLAW
jgi:hypothetical protein